MPLTVSALHARDGGIVGISKISRDISERNRLAAEKTRAVRRLAAIVESSDDGIIGMTLDGTITAWNQGAERMYGYSAGSDTQFTSSFPKTDERKSRTSSVGSSAGSESSTSRRFAVAKMEQSSR